MGLAILEATVRKDDDARRIDLPAMVAIGGRRDLRFGDDSEVKNPRTLLGFYLNFVWFSNLIVGFL